MGGNLLVVTFQLKYDWRQGGFSRGEFSRWQVIFQGRICCGSNLPGVIFMDAIFCGQYFGDNTPGRILQVVCFQGGFFGRKSSGGQFYRRQFSCHQPTHMHKSILLKKKRTRKDDRVTALLTVRMLNHRQTKLILRKD